MLCRSTFHTAIFSAIVNFLWVNSKHGREAKQFGKMAATVPPTQPQRRQTLCSRSPWLLFCLLNALKISLSNNKLELSRSLDRCCGGGVCVCVCVCVWCSCWHDFLPPHQPSLSLVGMPKTGWIRESERGDEVGGEGRRGRRQWTRMTLINSDIHGWCRLLLKM